MKWTKLREFHAKLKTVFITAWMIAAQQAILQSATAVQQKPPKQNAKLLNAVTVVNADNCK